MSEENKAIVTRFYETLDRHDLDALGEICSPDFRFNFTGAPSMDFPAFRQFISGFHAAFPDLRHNLEELIAEGDKVAVRLLLSGSHRGVFQGLPPTGKEIAVTGMGIFRIVNGKVVENSPLADSLGMLQQLGALPAPA